jgi:hypothetical protein
LSATPDSSDFYDLKSVSVRRSMTFLAAGALVGLAIAGYSLFSSKGTGGRDVPVEAMALVNQKPVLRSDFMTQAQNQFATPYEQVTHEQRLQVLKDMINEELLVQRGQEMDLASYDPDVRSALVAGVELEVTADVIAQQPTEPELRDYYEKHKGKYSSEGTLRMRDLLLKLPAGAAPGAIPEAASKAVAELRAGMPLEQVMGRYGLVDSGRFLDGGKVDTGQIFEFAAKAKLTDALYAVCVALKSGEISDPVAAEDGVHIIAMQIHNFPVPQDFTLAQDRVWTDLKGERQAAVNKSNLEYLRSRADVLITPELRR